MANIQIKNMAYTYGSYYKPVFENVNLDLNTDWKLGLVGRNGRGKTTLLRLIHGSLECDQGSILKMTETEIFPYDYSKSYTRTLDVIKDNIGPYFQLECDMQRLLEEGTEASYMEYAAVITRYNELEGYEIEAKIQREFNLMDLPLSLLERPFESLSGGEKTKALIIALFLRKNYFLLLDEPTNHLDIKGKKTLANYLSKKKGFIIVSHDRLFLDQVIDHVLSINKGSINLEKGSFSSWNENRLVQEQFELRQKDKIEAEVKMMEKAAQTSRRFSQHKEAQKKGATDKGFVGARAARLMKRAKNIERRREAQLEAKKGLLKNYEAIPKLVIKQEQVHSEAIIKLQDVSFSFGDRQLFSSLSAVIESGDRVWIRGENGAGKSTLLNIIRGRIRTYSGILKIQSNLAIAESYQEALWQRGFLKDLLQEHGIDRSVFQTTLAYFDMHDSYFERPIETFSQGELKKIDIARALASENHLIILDEPLNYMDLFFREQLEKAIKHYQPTMIFVEHDAYFGEAVATKIITL